MAASEPSERRRGGQRRERARYIDGQSFVHRLDPRTRLLVLVAMTTAAIMSSETLPVLAVAAMLGCLAVLTGHPRHWLTTLWKSAPIVALLILGNAFFPRVSYGPVYFAADFWLLHPSLTPGGILYALTTGLRLFVIIGISLLFIMTTRFEDVVSGLRKLGLPYVVSLSLGLSLRSVTFLTADIRGIIDAQRSRGLELEKGGLKTRAEHLMSLVTPMTVCIIHRSRNISSSMMCRGYGFSSHPTMYRQLKIGWADVAIILIMLAMVGVLAARQWLPV